LLLNRNVNVAENNDRIVLIGPVLPFRGGIAQHTTMLHRALESETTTLTLSFTRQYPSLLYPGKTDLDVTLGDYRENNVEYVIDSINPSTWNLAVQKVLIFNPRLIIFPWWHVYWSICFTWMARQFRRNGIEGVFLCHNVIEHESKWWKKIVAKFCLSNASRFFVHSQEDKRNLLGLLPYSNVTVYPHPINLHFPDPLGTKPRRAELEILFFGFVRHYKGLDLLIQAMGAFKGEDVVLSIVGEFWKDKATFVDHINSEGLDDQIDIIDRYVPDDEVADFFHRCDVVILPYRSATGSAVIPLAYRYSRPVIATRVGGLPDVVQEGITGLLIHGGSPKEIEKAIRFFRENKHYFSKSNFKLIREQLTWEKFTKSLLNPVKNEQEQKN